MQETKTNALGIRITDGELRRLEGIKSQLGLPSMANTTLGHDLLVMGMEQMEIRAKAGTSGKPGKQKGRQKQPSGEPVSQSVEELQV
jgi:hypothetical protein